MKINISKTVLVFFYVLLFTSISFPQTIGKIFSKMEADSLFGNVIDSISINQSELNSLLNKTENYIMFQINKGKLIILGDGRNVLYPVGKNVNSDEVFALFSKSKVVELLNSGKGTILIFEKRRSHLTITFDLVTLEFSVWCPPFCP